MRLRAIGQGGSAVFIGIAPKAAVDQWLGLTAHDEVSTLAGPGVTYQRQGGPAVPLASPAQQTFWSSSATGTGTQELRWPVQSGQWAIVLARPDGLPGVRATGPLLAMEEVEGARSRHAILRAGCSTRAVASRRRAQADRNHSGHGSGKTRGRACMFRRFV